MPDTIRLTIEFDKRKYNALEDIIGGANQSSVMAELEKHLDFLYENNVPEAQRAVIDKTNMQEWRAEQMQNEPGKEFSVIALHNSSGTVTFSSEHQLTFLDIAKVYRERVRDWGV